jgi:hypothetical protein
VAAQELGPHVLGVKICMTKSWPVTAPGSQGVFGAEGVGSKEYKSGRVALPNAVRYLLVPGLRTAIF